MKWKRGTFNRIRGAGREFVGRSQKRIWSKEKKNPGIRKKERSPIRVLRVNQEPRAECFGGCLGALFSCLTVFSHFLRLSLVSSMQIYDFAEDDWNSVGCHVGNFRVTAIKRTFCFVLTSSDGWMDGWMVILYSGYDSIALDSSHSLLIFTYF